MAISANQSTHQLLGYVEYFSTYRMVILLSNNYIGESFTQVVYGIDPIEGKKIDLSANLDFSPEEIRAIFNYEKIPDGSLEKALEQVMPIGIKRSLIREIERVSEEAVSYGFDAKYGEILTENHARKVVKHALENLEPFIASYCNRLKI